MLEIFINLFTGDIQGFQLRLLKYILAQELVGFYLLIFRGTVLTVRVVSVFRSGDQSLRANQSIRHFSDNSTSIVDNPEQRNIPNLRDASRLKVLFIHLSCPFMDFLLICESESATKTVGPSLTKNLFQFLTYRCDLFNCQNATEWVSPWEGFSALPGPVRGRGESTRTADCAPAPPGTSWFRQSATELPGASAEAVSRTWSTYGSTRTVGNAPPPLPLSSFPSPNIIPLSSPSVIPPFFSFFFSYLLIFNSSQVQSFFRSFHSRYFLIFIPFLDSLYIVKFFIPSCLLWI